MKKVIAILLASVMVLSLSACGSGDNSGESSASTGAKIVTTDDSNYGSYENGIYVTPVYEDTALNATGSAGPIQYTVKGIRIAKAFSPDEDTAKDLEVEPNKEFSLVSMTIYFENTSDESVCFLVSQSSVFTNTETDIPANGLLSDLMNEEVPAHGTWEGTEYYVLKETDADDIESLKFALFPPFDENGNDLSQDVEISITLPNSK